MVPISIVGDNAGRATGVWDGSEEYNLLACPFSEMMYVALHGLLNFPKIGFL